MRVFFWTLLLLTACGGSEPEEVWVDRLPERALPGAAPLPEGRSFADRALMPLRLRAAPLEDGEDGPAREIERSRAGEAHLFSDQRHVRFVSANSLVPGEIRIEGLEGVERLRGAVGVEPIRDCPGELFVSMHVTPVAAEGPGGEWPEPSGWADLAARLPHAPEEGPALALWTEWTWETEGAEAAILRLQVRDAEQHLPDCPMRVGWTSPERCSSLRSQADPRPDVIFVSVDTLRADRLGSYGYERDTTPNLDRLAARGVRFERAWTSSSWTLPSYASFLTGLYPSEHRAGISAKAAPWPSEEASEAKGSERLAEAVPTLAGMLSGAGYATAAFYANPFLDPESGLDRGFERHVRYGFNAEVGVDLALEWLERGDERPRFLFLHAIDPHWPYAPPAPYDRAFRERGYRAADAPPQVGKLRKQELSPEQRSYFVDMYDGEVAFTDAALGRFLDALPPDCLVVFHSDHGEELWDHGGFEHGHTLFEELLRVPLILSFPGRLPAGRVVSNQVRTIDVVPTVLELLGYRPPAGLRGSSLLPFVEGELPGVQLEAYAEGILWGRPLMPWDEAKALVTGDQKVVWHAPAGGLSLFYLEDDPGEQEDLAEREAAAAERMGERLRRMHAELDRGPAELLGLDADTQRELGGLGYVEED